MAGAGTVVVGVDRSGASRRAVEFALDRCREASAGLFLTHVIPWSPYSFTTLQENEERPKRHSAELAAAEEQVLSPLERLADGLAVETIARHGHPAETLISLAREHGAVHIIVGRTGESRLRAMFLGSMPTQLIQMSDVPVTVVP